MKSNSNKLQYPICGKKIIRTNFMQKINIGMKFIIYAARLFSLISPFGS